MESILRSFVSYKLVPISGLSSHVAETVCGILFLEDHLHDCRVDGGTEQKKTDVITGLAGTIVLRAE